MKPRHAKPLQSVQWLPAEHLGQMKIDGAIRSWLIGRATLTVKMRSVCAQRYRLHLVDEYSAPLTGSQRLGLRCVEWAGLIRDVELCCAERVWIFAQTVIPDATLCAHPWLAELGETAIDETLDALTGIEPGCYEYAWVPDGDPLMVRALRDAQVKPAGLWARRVRVALRGAPLLMQEVFLPALSRL